jgi:hypothetical protein
MAGRNTPGIAAAASPVAAAPLTTCRRLIERIFLIMALSSLQLGPAAVQPAIEGHKTSECFLSVCDQKS